MMIICIVSLIILQKFYTTSSEDVVQTKGDCCIFDFINKELVDRFCAKDLKQNCLDAAAIEKTSKCYELQGGANCYPEECTEIDEDGCTIITKSGKYDETQCPYNYALTPELTDAVWYPARRNMKRGIGQFLIEEIDEHYGEIEEDYEYYTSISRSHCMVIEFGKLIATPCDESYSRGCKYKPLQNNQLAYCNANLPDCFNAHFDTSSLKCLCYSGISDCIRSDSFNIQDLCFKLKRNYFLNLYGIKSGLDEFLKDKIKDLRCSVCESEFPYTMPRYVFENKNNHLELTFYEHSNLVSTKSGRVFCMTDAYENVLIKRLEIDEIEAHNSLKVSYLPSLSGHYWCEAFEIKHFSKIITNEIWIYTQNVYPMVIVVLYEYDQDPTSSNVAYKKYILPIEKLYNLKYGNLGVIQLDIVIKWMKTIEIDEINNQVTYLIHICTKLNLDLHETHYQDLKKKIPAVLFEKQYVLEHSELYSSLFCMENKTLHNNMRLTWAKTSIGDSAESKERCLDGFTVTRKCRGSYFDGGRWEDVAACGWNASFESEITKNLSNMLHSNLSTPEMIYDLMEITEDTDDFQAIDVYLVSSILLKANPEEVDLDNITNIINNVMFVDQYTLKKSQIKFNATDRILYSFDLILNTNKYSQTDFLKQTDNVISFTFDCNVTEYAGLALIGNDDEFIALKIKRNTTLEDLITAPGLEVVNYLPNLLLEYLADEYPKIIINIFLSDVLFNDNEQTSVAKNFGILLDEKKQLPENITLLFKPKYNVTTGACGFWDYGFDNEDPIFGKWSISNDAEIYNIFHKCKFLHVTHFGLLISDRDIIGDTFALEIITNIECTLSLIGFFGIFTTAALFKSWRNNRGNRILLHYTFVSCLQIILVYLSQMAYEKGTFSLCIIIGASLHYTILSQFSWMLVISYLQYKRYVTVFLGTQKFLLMKALIICYFLPTIPVSVLLIFYTKNYTEGNGGICYPTGQGLMFGILIPIIIIVISNIIIFIRIVLELFCLRRNKCVDDIFLLRLRLVVLMFFMLGVTWGLGFAAQIFDSSTLLYAFCSTASLQGFIIFMFFIVLNKNTRIMYSYMCRKYNYA